MRNISWEFYENKAGQWRWRKTAANNVIAASERFSSKQAAVSNAELNGYQGS